MHTTFRAEHSAGGAGFRSVKCDGDTAERMPNAQFIKVKSRPPPRAADTSQRCSDNE